MEEKVAAEVTPEVTRSKTNWYVNVSSAVLMSRVYFVHVGNIVDEHIDRATRSSVMPHQSYRFYKTYQTCVLSTCY
jgi:hypothetical protein